MICEISFSQIIGSILLYSTSRISLFSGLVYCYDCKAKLHFAAAKSITRNQEHFRCSNYKSGRRECAAHYIRDVILEKLVLEAISDLADFVRCYEPVFLYMLAKKNNAMRQKEYKRLQQAVESSTKRIAEIDRLIEKVLSRTLPAFSPTNGLLKCSKITRRSSRH